MRKWSWLVVLAVVATGAQAADPTDTPSFTYVPDSESFLNEVPDADVPPDTKPTMAELVQRINERLRERKVECLRALGKEALCECLHNKLGIGVQMKHYVVVTTRTK